MDASRVFAHARPAASRADKAMDADPSRRGERRGMTDWDKLWHISRS